MLVCFTSFNPFLLQGTWPLYPQAEDCEFGELVPCCRRTAGSRWQRVPPYLWCCGPLTSLAWVLRTAHVRRTETSRSWLNHFVILSVNLELFCSGNQGVSLLVWALQLGGYSLPRRLLIFCSVWGLFFLLQLLLCVGPVHGVTAM